MYLISACLIGENCKYDGNNNFHKTAKALFDKGLAIPVCPEQLGGLPTPRLPSEIVGDETIMIDGRNVTKEYNLGAKKTLEIASSNNASIAILQARSPSCGSKYIYDGTFSGKLISGQGKTAELLEANGIRVITIDEFLESDYEK